MSSFLAIGVGLIVAWLIFRRIVSTILFIVGLMGLYLFLSGSDFKVGDNIVDDLKNKISGLINAEQLNRIGKGRNLEDMLKNVKDLTDVKKVMGSLSQVVDTKQLNQVKSAIGKIRGFDAKDKALLYAAEKGQTTVAEMLLKNHANINAKDEYGCTPLILATVNYQPDMIKTLMSHYLDPNRTDNNGYTALMHATLVGYMEGFNLLISDLNTSQKNKGETLIIAASLGRLEMIGLLIKNHANINYKDRKGKTALMHAASNGYMKIVQELIDSGADLDAKDNKGRTALTIAKQKERTEIIEILKEAGAE